jgi:hypothetical protein
MLERLAGINLGGGLSQHGRIEDGWRWWWLGLYGRPAALGVERA